MPTLPQSRRDDSAIHGRAVALVAAGILAIVFVVTMLVRLLSAHDGIGTVASSRVVQPPALSNTDPAGLLQAYQAQQAALLNGYGWQNAAHDCAHIPIARAMQLLVQHPGLAAPSDTGPGSAPRLPENAP